MNLEFERDIINMDVTREQSSFSSSRDNIRKKYSDNFISNYFEYLKTKEDKNDQDEFVLGMIYYFGFGMYSENYTEANYLFKSSADKNNIYAQGLYGFSERNLEYLELSAKHNYKNALFGLYYYYRDDGDYEKSLYWVTQAAYANHTEAQYLLYMHYERLDSDKSFYWLELSSNKNFSRAIDHLKYGCYCPNRLRRFKRNNKSHVFINEMLKFYLIDPLINIKDYVVFNYDSLYYENLNIKEQIKKINDLIIKDYSKKFIIKNFGFNDEIDNIILNYFPKLILTIEK